MCVSGFTCTIYADLYSRLTREGLVIALYGSLHRTSRRKLNL